MNNTSENYFVDFDGLEPGDVFSGKNSTELFMKIESSPANAVSLTTGKLICEDDDDEILFYPNARVAL